jgi:hypothetical protein
MSKPEQLASAHEVHLLELNVTLKFLILARVEPQDTGADRLAIKLSSWSESMGLVK